MREAIAIAAALDSHTRALSNLSLHGQRLSRQFEKTLALLQQLRSTRLANEAADLVQTHPMERNPIIPPPLASFFQIKKSRATPFRPELNGRSKLVFECTVPSFRVPVQTMLRGKVL